MVNFKKQKIIFFAFWITIFWHLNAAFLVFKTPLFGYLKCQFVKTNANFWHFEYQKYFMKLQMEKSLHLKARNCCLNVGIYCLWNCPRVWVRIEHVSSNWQPTHIVVSIGVFLSHFVHFQIMKYTSFVSFLIARSFNISAHTHFEQNFKALKVTL